MTEKLILGPTAEIDFPTLMSAWKSDIMASMNCVQIGTIQAYNSLTNMSIASVNFKKRFLDGSEVSYPLLGDLPTFILSGGDAQITMPISKGDQCLILFNDRNIDQWYLSGTVDAPDDARCHSIADGICLVGIRNLTTAKLTPANSVCIDGGSKKVAIKNTAGGSLKSWLNSFVDAVGGIQTKGTALAQSVDPAYKLANLDVLKTSLALLLDEGAS